MKMSEYTLIGCIDEDEDVGLCACCTFRGMLRRCVDWRNNHGAYKIYKKKGGAEDE